jgi:hypothetical protein
LRHAAHEYPTPSSVWCDESVTNRANVLVSLKDGYHYGSPFFDWLVTMRSTHGNLRRTSMTGFFMRNGPMPAAVLPARELLRNFAEEKVH